MSQANGLRPDWRNIPRVVVVITDGASNPSSENPAGIAKQLKDDGVIVFAVGVKGYLMNELKGSYALHEAHQKQFCSGRCHQ